MNAPKKLLVVLPGWLTDKTLRRKLERAGYIIVETEQVEAIRVIEPDFPEVGGEVVQKLARLVLENYSDSGRAAIGTIVLRKLLSPVPPKKPGESTK